MLKNKEDVEDFVRGCTFFGTGGGGDPKLGLRLLMEDLEKDIKIKFFKIHELNLSNQKSCGSWYMGSIAPPSDNINVIDRNSDTHAVKTPNLIKEAVTGLENYFGEKIDILVPFEIGGGATPAVLDASVKLGKRMVDGDYAGGRAVPEFLQTVPQLVNVLVSPMSLVDSKGNKAIITEATDNFMAERLGKLFTQASSGLAGLAGFVQNSSDLKISNNTVSRALIVGRSIREAWKKKSDPVEAASKSSGGKIIFKGKVIKSEWEDKDGYMYGTHEMSGTGKYTGKRLRVWFKNENHIAWLNDKPLATSPDIIAQVYTETSKPALNTTIAKGDELSFILIRAPINFVTPWALSFTGPRHYGFDFDYMGVNNKKRDE